MRLDENLRIWASDIDDVTLEQARRSARHPALAGPIALMADAHLGMGATIGSVIATRGAIIPSAVGVDIGCGMVALETDLTESRLPDDLEPLLERVAAGVPAGLGKWHDEAERGARSWMETHPNPLTASQENRALLQLGTLGSGNHFVELAADERERMWIILHSGSRGVGNQLAQQHIKTAIRVSEVLDGDLAYDKDLAYFVEGTPEFAAYVRDMQWAQDYAMFNRHLIAAEVAAALHAETGAGTRREINCHHNYAARETLPTGEQVWVTRKGAIRAEVGDYGLIPGHMGGESYVVRGRGNPDSYYSAPHGAGRRMSRRKARESIAIPDFERAMAGRTWQAGDAEKLVDEAPGAYKNVHQVVAVDSADLVEIVHTLRGVLSYKGVEEKRRRR